MSEQENTSGKAAGQGSPMVAESAPSKHTVLHRPTEQPDEAAPNLYQIQYNSIDIPDTKNLKESEYELSTDRQKHVAKKLSSNMSKTRGSASPVAIPMTPIESQSKADNTTTAKVSPIPDIDTDKVELGKADENSIISEITELRTPDAAKRSMEWSDEEEAGGLPRSESRASRVTRAVRQLFCCGVQLEAPSEDNVSHTRSGFFNSDARQRKKFYLKEKDKDTEGDNEEEDVEQAVPLRRKLGNEIIDTSLVTNKEHDVIEPSTSTEVFKKKGISWSDETYLEKVPLQELGVRSASWMLERKTSVGPCYRRGMPCTQPSGITICLPKKYFKSDNVIPNDFHPIRSGISLTMTRRCVDNKSKSFGPYEYEMSRIKVESTLKMEDDLGLKLKEENYSNHCANFKGKLDNLCGRIRHALHI